jgi:DNA-binding transcriptional MerR regulator
MFRIATFARLGGASAKVLRDYDRLGLFRPVWVDPATGYRMYSPAQLPSLRRILALRDLGVSLEEIRTLVGEGADLRSVLERRRASLEEARREVDRRLASLGISIAATARGSAGPDVVVRDVPAELVATLDVATLGGDIGGAFYELERAIRDAGVRAPRPPGLLEADGSGRGSVSDPELEVFVPVRRGAASLATRRLPAIRAATALHQGSYAGLLQTRAALDAWIAAAGLVAGRPSRILYLQFGAEPDLRLPRQYLVDRATDLVTELQVPIA